MFCEEFEVGQRFTLKPLTFERQEIMDFAEIYDPQPIHIDESFANDGIFRGIIASGVHTLSVIWSEWIQTGRFGTEIIGGKGLDFVTWSAPVRPGDTLFTEVEVVDVIPSPDKGRGLLLIKFTSKNQDGQTALTTQARVYLKSRL